MTTTKPETGHYRESAHGAFYFAYDQARAAGHAEGASTDAGRAAQVAYMASVGEQLPNTRPAPVQKPATTAPRLHNRQVIIVRHVRATLLELASADDCDNDTAGALLLARADLGTVLADCEVLEDDDDDDGSLLDLLRR